MLRNPTISFVRSIPHSFLYIHHTYETNETVGVRNIVSQRQLLSL